MTTSAAQSQAELPTTMRAVVVHGPEDYRLEERPGAPPGPGALRRRTDGGGGCASGLAVLALPLTARLRPEVLPRC